LQHRGPELPEEQILELRATLYSQTARLRDLAEALLDLSRLDPGVMRLKMERFLARDHIEDLLPRIAPDHVTHFEVAVDPDFELAYARSLGGALIYEPASPRGARFTLRLPA